MVCELIAWEATFDRNKGFSAAQKESIWAIKPRKTARPWAGIFKVLFPEDPESSYPHPCKSLAYSTRYYKNLPAWFRSLHRPIDLTCHSDHCNAPLVQFSHQLQEHWIQQSRSIVPQRLVNAPFLSNLSGRTFQEASDHLVQFVNQLSVEIIQSFQRSLIESIQRGEQPTASPDVQTSSRQPFTDVSPPLTVFTTGSAESLGSDIDAVIPSHVSSVPHPDPLDPHLTFLGYLSDIAPTLGVDNAWANNLNDFLRGDFSANLHNGSGINPQLPVAGSDGGNRPVADGSAVEPSLVDPVLSFEPNESVQTFEDGWDIVNA